MKNQLMSKSLLQLLLAGGISGAAASHSLAVVQSSSEVWVGSCSAIQGITVTDSKLNLFSQRMVRPLETAGTVGTLATASLVDTNGTWTDSQFGTNGLPSYVEFDNGWTADIADCSAAGHCLTLAGNLSGAVTNGAAYRIHQHFTISTMFGTNNEVGIKSGLNPTTSDNILLENPQTQQVLTIFYYDDGTYRGWLHADYSPADNEIIYPEQGVMVRRRLSGDVNLYLAGPVKTGVTVVTIDPGNNLVGTLKSITPMALSGLNLYTGDPTTGIASGLNLTTSDNLVVVQPDSSVQMYFYYQDPTYQGWFDAAYNPADSVQINPGSAFFVHRRTPNPSFNWTIPAE